MSNDKFGTRCGIGFDSHRLAAGRPLRIGGVEIPSDRGLVGHSDGDVLSHAIADALLGAAGLGDIGQHFPDTDTKWKGANSLKFLEIVKGLLEDNGLRILNLDSVVVIDHPKLAPHREKICNSLAAALGIEPAQVNLKAKTTEGTAPDLASAHAVALLGEL